MTHKTCCGPNTEHPPTFEWEDSTQYLRDTGQLEEAQKTFNYWNPKNDSNNIWNGSGDFGDWLNSLPAEATDKWRNYKMSCANMVAWNCGSWGPEYKNMDVRGNSVSVPGGDTAIWNPDGSGTMHISEWPYAADWLEITEEDGFSSHIGWYYAP